MANNRMYLVYRPTGDYVYLGKRMGWGWYGTPDNLAEQVLNLFDIAAENTGESQDDFLLAMESAENQPFVLDGELWESTEDKKMKINDSVPYGKAEAI